MVGHRATARDVAERAGVHPSTVSRSLDPAKRMHVKESTRERVERAAAELGYRPDLTASSLRRRSSRTIGVVISSFSNPVFGELLHAICSELEDSGYHVLIAEVIDVPDAARLAPAIDMLHARRIDGLICASARGSDASVLEPLVESGLPVVLSLRWVPADGVARVVSDDAEGGRIAAEHLLALGHRRILEVRGPTDISSFSERTRGFREAVEASGIDVDLRAVQITTPSIEEGREAVGRAAAEHPELHPTAVFAHNDLLAVGVVAALEDAGLDCPGDVSVVGFNDNPLTGYLRPALTTVALQTDEMGRESARAVMRLVRADGTAPAEVSLAPVLIPRASTGPVGGQPRLVTAVRAAARR